MFFNLLTTTTSGFISLDVVDAILNIMTSILEMFKVEPLNYFLTASIIGIGIGVFRKLKRS